jgi:hypothetical protein
MIKKTWMILTTLPFLILLPAPARANDLVISGNASGSVNIISQNTSSVVAISQSGNSEINNSVTVQTDTGQNSASQTTGGQEKIVTGTVSQEVKIENQSHVSSFTAAPCPAPVSPLPNPPPSVPPAPPSPPTPPPPAPPPGGGVGGGDANTTATTTSPAASDTPQGDVLGASTGEVLPATGNWGFAGMAELFLLTGLVGVTLRAKSHLLVR